jgi:hypothetical protein
MPSLFNALMSLYRDVPAGALEPSNTWHRSRIRTIESQKGSEMADVTTVDSFDVRSDKRYDVTVEVNQRVTAEDWYQDVRHVELALNEDV